MRHTVLFKKILLLSIFVPLLSACATGNKIDVQAELNRWVGQDADILVRSWGAPDRMYDFKDGTRIMEYERNRVDTYGGLNRPYGGISVGSKGSAIGVGVPIWDNEPRISIRRCTMKFETNKNYVIKSATYIGPNCAYALKNSIEKK
jgi:hypothetical protein